MLATIGLVLLMLETRSSGIDCVAVALHKKV